jgi:hypothetical protein
MSELFQSLRQAQQDLQLRLKEQGKLAFQEHLKEFFEKNPEVESLRWTQYTPYFNDGDECHFRVNEMTAKGPGIKGYAWDDDFVSGYSIEDKKVKDAVESLGSEFDSMPEVLLMAFGDHQQITASRNGIEVERYDHE